MNNIQDTGIKGYLKWLQQDQPALYVLAAPIIAQQVPEAFSDHEQSMSMGGLMGFADDSASGATSGDSSGASADVADAANSGAASPNVASVIGNVVTAVAQGYLLKNQIDALSQLNTIQLQRASAGLTPLTTTTGSLGVPTVQLPQASSTTTSSVLMLAAIGIGLAIVLSGGGHRAAAAA